MRAEMYVALGLGFLAPSCGGGEDPSDTPSRTEVPGSPTPAPTSPQEATPTPAVVTQNLREVVVQFGVQVDGANFQCGERYRDLGTTLSDFLPMDMRFFVHDVILVTEDQREIPLPLEDNGTWQAYGVALLDFEDGKGSCTNGTSQTNTSISGLVPVDSYTGIKFRVGVTEEVNLLDPALAQPPFNSYTMYWSWATGYKFMKIEGKTGGYPSGWLFHLGSVGCTTTDTGNIDTCSHPNRAEVELTNFDPDTSIVVLDLAGLLSGSNLDLAGDNSPGCMSQTTDPDCSPLYSALGLPEEGGTQMEPQHSFSAVLAP